MSAAIVHFIAGAGTMLFLLPFITRFTSANFQGQNIIPAFLAGVFALTPDIHHAVPHAPTAKVIYTVHNHAVSNIFFFHHVLDSAAIRGMYKEMIGVAIVYLGVAIHLNQRYSDSQPTPVSGEDSHN